MQRMPLTTAFIVSLLWATAICIIAYSVLEETPIAAAFDASAE